MINDVAGQYNAQDIEAQVRDLWEKSVTYSKTRSKRADGKKFFFVDGPPYTTGRIHPGTAWNKVIKDAVLRYKSMNGFALQDRSGWDMHGLPIEVKVEESFGFKSKKDIEASWDAVENTSRMLIRTGLDYLSDFLASLNRICGMAVSLQGHPT